MEKAQPFQYGENRNVGMHARMSVISEGIGWYFGCVCVCGMA